MIAALLGFVFGFLWSHQGTLRYLASGTELTFSRYLAAGLLGPVVRIPAVLRQLERLP